MSDSPQAIRRRQRRDARHAPSLVKFDGERFGMRHARTYEHHRSGIRWRNVGHISSLAEKKPYVFDALYAVAENAYGAGNPPALATRPGVECCSWYSSQAVDWMRRSRSRPVSKPISCNR